MKPFPWLLTAQAVHQHSDDAVFFSTQSAGENISSLEVAC